MPRAKKGCAKPQCHNRQPCPVHGKWTGRKMPANWAKTRRQVLAECGGICEVPGCPNRATEVDHIIPHSQGGSEARSNLRGICEPHHRVKSAEERNWRRKRRGDS